jgi:hypothetical protein
MKEGLSSSKYSEDMIILSSLGGRVPLVEPDLFDFNVIHISL